MGPRKVLRKRRSLINCVPKYPVKREGEYIVDTFDFSKIIDVAHDTSGFASRVMISVSC